MRISRAIMVVLLPLSLTLSGCVLVVDGSKGERSSSVFSQSDWQKLEQSNRKQIAALDTGESLAQVLDKMGTPDFDERLTKGDTDYRALFYRTHRVKSDGQTTRDECTPLVFENGTLIGWGEHKLKVAFGAELVSL
ncbi:hypothetical protein CWE09_01295 [Aliidiomarina minuta]|uniref:DUF3192 domain-containing protein n=1 Tax=Aliidiomarina minuta TaxID=880057 RepID=A0A432W5Z5_9GAMM|nr:DUF3192 domain-containing protein [Aliidiomarina minuta]RUO25399.1 hypothetical protein CWE09_01295 [Aliidiomarina minuta]